MNASFVYDGLRRREKKTINGNLTEFLFDGLNPVQETSGANILANILPGLGIDEFLVRTGVAAGVTSSFLPDALGSSVALTDAAGIVQTEYTYEPFGKTGVTGTSNTNSYQYTGRENDGTGLYYYRARYYHPQLQRFISEDPIDFAGGDINLYAYVLNNPLAYTDPSGESLRTICRQIAKFVKGWGRIIILVCELIGREQGPRPPGPPVPTPPKRTAPPKGPPGAVPPIPPGDEPPPNEPPGEPPPGCGRKDCTPPEPPRPDPPRPDWPSGPTF